jgi:propanol-preferring alcohol dehydrogenase
VRAYRLTGARHVGLADVAPPAPGPGEVLVRVGANGVCHSDLVIIEMPEALPHLQLPVTLGHEVAGWVAATGPGVDAPAPDTPVGVYSLIGCGHCPRCVRGEDNACAAGVPPSIGVDRDGGLADFIVVPARNLVPLGDLDPVAAAPLMDAGLTAFRAVRAARPQLEPGATCLIIGVGGLGHLAVQIVRATSPARVIAVDREPARLTHAEALGAASALPASDSVATDVRVAVGARVDAVFDFVGSDESVALAAATVAPGGTVVLVGMGFGTVSVVAGLGGTLPPETTVLGTVYGSRHDLRDVVALARTGRIEPAVTRFSLDDASQAIQAVADHTVAGRAVVVP